MGLSCSSAFDKQDAKNGEGEHGETGLNRVMGGEQMKRWILLLALFLVCLAETACGAGLYSLALVKKDQVNIRKAPGGQMVDRLRKGEWVNILGTEIRGGREWDRIIVSRKTDNQVICGYVDAAFLEDVTEIYSGIYGWVNINFYPYFFSGKKGIGCGLNHVMKTRDGQPLGGSAPSVDEAFAGVTLPAVDPITGMPL